MKLIRFGEKGKEKPGIFSDGKRYDLSDYFNDWNPEFFRQDGLVQLKRFLDNATGLTAVDDSVRWAPPVPRPGKTLCIGLNYSDHAKESGATVPDEPLLFMKGGNAFSGPNDRIVIPRGSEKCDYEIELGIVLAKDALYVDNPADAAEYIAGYVISNDISEREYQKEHCGQWCKGKSCDTFHPVGPFLVTADEMADVTNLTMRLTVNGEVRQNGSTGSMIFKPDFLVHYLSQFMTLEAGDLISTGTPPGVAMGMTPPQFLKPGDTLELEIDGLGSQKQTCVAWNSPIS